MVTKVSLLKTLDWDYVMHFSQNSSVVDLRVDTLFLDSLNWCDFFIFEKKEKKYYENIIINFFIIKIKQQTIVYFSRCYRNFVTNCRGGQIHFILLICNTNL